MGSDFESILAAELGRLRSGAQAKPEQNLLHELRELGRKNHNDIVREVLFPKPKPNPHTTSAGQSSNGLAEVLEIREALRERGRIDSLRAILNRRRAA